MSIDRTSPLKPVSTVQPRETTDAPVTMDTGKIADALINEAQQDLQSN